MSICYSSQAMIDRMFEGHFGLEKESLRVNKDAFLSHTAHPFPNNPNMDRDFCENQTELITKVCDSVEEVYTELSELHKQAVRTLLRLESGEEYLWPFSNPPYVKGEEDIPVAAFGGALKGKEVYRRYLASKYGKKKMLFSGIHFNFSFSEELLQEGYKSSKHSSYQEYKNDIYLELAKKITKYTWLIVYLTAASPVMDGSFYRDDAIGQDVRQQYSSARCSEIGYWNDFIPLLEYEDLDSYVRSIQDYVDQGQLKSASELYYPVRLKPAGENSLDNLRERGVNHIEIRTIDLNPLSPVGIMEEDIRFLHLLILYLTSLEDGRFETFEQIMAIKNEKRAAEYEVKNIWIETGWTSMIPIHDAALEVLHAMEIFYESLGKGEVTDCIAYQEEKVLYPTRRYASRIRKEYGHGYVEKGLKLVKQYAENIRQEEIKRV